MKRDDIRKSLDIRFGKAYTIEENVSMTALHCDLVILAGVTVRYADAGRPVSKQGWGTAYISSCLVLEKELPGAIEKALERALENATEELLRKAKAMPWIA